VSDKNPPLGSKVRDKVTHFEGMLTGHAKHLTGCDTVCITPTIDSEGRLRDNQWFDIDRVEILEEDQPCGFAPWVDCQK
jgi:hypothetical protein